MQIHFSLFGGLDSRFLLGNEVFLSREAGRVNGMKSQKWELGPRYFNEALLLECSFYGMEGNVLNGMIR
ncbi:hypothetical protein [Mariniflexile sp.]|uniref:hypothetical protein n=1 Tax=Mariniflexile sp. TaxID=1979402 RepID=UPI004048C7C3